MRYGGLLSEIYRAIGRETVGYYVRYGRLLSETR